MENGINNDKKSAAYYRAAMLMEAPPFVPARIRVLKDVYGDFPYAGAGIVAGDYDCQCNKWGAVSIIARDGKPLGLRPNEFEPLEWKANSITA